jgi:hypothetical protein
MPLSKSCNDFFRRMLIHIGSCFNSCFNCFNCCKEDSPPNLNFNNPLNDRPITFINPIYQIRYEEEEKNKYNSYNFLGQIKYTEFDNINENDELIYDINDDL